MGSLALSEEPLAHGDSATMSKLSSTEINRLLLFSCSEVAPPSLFIVRVLVVPAAPSPVEVGPSASSPDTETTAMEFPSVSAPVETCITEASHAACSKSVVVAPVSTPVEVGTAGSIQDVATSGLSSGSTSGVADRSSGGSLDLSEELLILSEEPLARVGSARSIPPSDRSPWLAEAQLVPLLPPTE